ncbi:MAG: sodium-dependent transporter [Clostridia bacterium]|nr:sodium-dependent transporter [Clostridia bacterium]
MSDQRWSNRFTFILAAIGSAVGLGNCWRFPGLVAKHGGGAFLLVYMLAMLVMGIPLLAMEIAIGRRMRGGAPKALKGIHKHGEKVGWSAVANGFIICCYYTVIFAWVIAMVFSSFNFAGMTGNTDAAGEFFIKDVAQTTGGVSFFGEGGDIPVLMLIALVVAWALVYYCIRDGAASVGKVVKYTVFIPVVLLAVLMIKGFIGNPNLGAAMHDLFVPDMSALGTPDIWIDAFGQVFYSLSVMMAIMMVYGSYLPKDSNIAVDTLIIAFGDLFISILSSIVLFSTIYSTGMASEMTTTGIATAFIVYPQAIVQFTSIGWVNAIFGVIFYLTLSTLAIDSAFSIAEGVSRALSDKFGIPQKKATISIVLVMAAISVVFITGAGIGWLDIVDNWANTFNLILIGIAECIFVGWVFKPKKVLDEVNKNTKKYKMPRWWFETSVKILSPLVLTFFFGWNLIALFKTPGGYENYPIWAQIIGGWLISALVLATGFIVAFLCKKNKKLKAMSEKAEANEKTWDEMEAINDAEGEETPVESVIEAAAQEN